MSAAHMVPHGLKSRLCIIRDSLSGNSGSHSVLCVTAGECRDCVLAAGPHEALVQAVLRYLGSGVSSLRPDDSAANGGPEGTPTDPGPTGVAPLAAGHAYAGKRLLITQHDAIYPKWAKHLQPHNLLCCGKLQAA